jgi:hypothetical protein
MIVVTVAWLLSIAGLTMDGFLEYGNLWMGVLGAIPCPSTFYAIAMVALLAFWFGSRED